MFTYVNVCKGALLGRTAALCLRGGAGSDSDIGISKPADCVLDMRGNQSHGFCTVQWKHVLAWSGEFGRCHASYRAVTDACFWRTLSGFASWPNSENACMTASVHLQVCD